MCRYLGVSRNTVYYQRQQKSHLQYKSLQASIHQAAVKTEFKASYESYGTRRLKVALQQRGLTLSRRHISRIMHSAGLVSKYTQSSYKVHSSACNESAIPNLLDREFAPGSGESVLVTDLTYVKVRERWHYICMLVDLTNRQIVGKSVGKHKNAQLVMQAISRIAMNLSTVRLFHSDRGKEFDNRLIDRCLSAFNIKRSLSHKGCPYDNAVAEATFKSIKTECIKGEKFESIEELERKLNGYVTWFNHQRIHSSLNNQSPIQYKQNGFR